MYKINVQDLEVYAYHGVLQEEKTLGQRFLVSAEMVLNESTTACTDDIERSVDYASVCALIVKVTQEVKFNLIETLAETIADRVLLEYYKVRSVRVRVSKPSAPVPLHFKSISVEVERSWHRVYVSMGSNMGDRHQYLNGAIRDIAVNPLCRVLSISKFLNTKPVGGVPQDDFLNACVCVETLYSPYEFLDLLHSIESSAGRVRDVHWGPRTLDLDILLFDDLTLSDSLLTVPHSEMANRLFVLEPLNEIAPHVVHPIYKCTVFELLERLRSTGATL